MLFYQRNKNFAGVIRVLLMHSFTISFYICAIYIFNYCYSERSGWGYINVHCRDNDNAPVDWWYIYKPPSEAVSFFESGLNFTFITPSSKGRWEASSKYITTNSMLQYTLAPIFRPTYTDYIAVAVYEKRDASKDFAGTITYGVIIADEMGGVWIYHTVPGLVNIERDRPIFSNEESAKGHLLMCLSFDLAAMNTIIRNLKQIQPKFIYLKVPRRLRDLLPEWNLDKVTLISKSLKVIELQTPDDTLHVEILMKPPGNKKTLYKIFASSKNTVLDVYGQSQSNFSPVCGKKYSVRSIDSISFKYPETVFYINNSTDRVHFAVSTAGRPDRGSHVPREYWTCISNLDKDVTRVGGDMVCVKNYKIWLAFDNLKVKEPKC